MKNEKKEEILAWIGTSCPWCDWTGKVEVNKKDKQGNLVVRCPECKERIRIG